MKKLFLIPFLLAFLLTGCLNSLLGSERASGSCAGLTCDIVFQTPEGVPVQAYAFEVDGLNATVVSINGQTPVDASEADGTQIACANDVDPIDPSKALVQCFIPDIPPDETVSAVITGSDLTAVFKTVIGVDVWPVKF